MRRTAVLVPLVLIGSGCFTYAPVEYSTLAPDMTVRVQLANQTQSPQVEGRIFEVDANHLALLPEVQPGQPNDPRSLPRPEILTVEMRTLNTSRTLVVVGASIAAGIAVLALAEGGGGVNGPPGNGGVLFEPIPLLRFFLGR